MPKSNLLSSKFSKKGVTFAELLTALGLGLLVMTITVGSLYYSSRAAKEASSVSSRDFELMKVYHQMRIQLLDLYESPYSDDFPVSFQQEKAPGPEMDMFRFLTTKSMNGYGTVEAAYSIQKEEDGDTWLGYREEPFPRNMTLAENTIAHLPPEQWKQLSARITGMTITYISGTDGENIIEETVLPEGALPGKIKISLFYRAQTGTEEFGFTVTPGIVMLKREGL